MDKETKEQIKKLKKDKKYDEIYLKYGSDIYVKNTPNKIKKKEIKKLFSEGKYIDIYNKYGEKQYNKILLKAMYREIKDNTNVIKATLWRIKKSMIKGLKNTLIVATGVLTLGPPAIAVSGAEFVKDEKNKNQIIYEEDIENYNERINKYAQEVNSMNLDNMQIFMKVMNDMWGSIKGYGAPQNDIIGFPELELATEDGYGVCRNMASDVAKKLNAINPKYNARTMIVKMGEDGKYEIADIKRNFVEVQEENEEQESQEVQEQKGPSIIDNIIENINGNHLVTLVDITEDNLILVLDPTNPGIGIYKDGEITMLNSDKENGLTFEAKEYISSFMTKGGLENITDVIKDYVKSFEKSNLTNQEIEEKYGLEAQNRSLNYIRTKGKRVEFIESMKVNDSGEEYNTEKNYEENEKDISQEGKER